MAPGLPEIAQKYNITSSTTVAMTLSIFLLAYALGVSPAHGSEVTALSRS
jgi:hypothetical protein